MNLILPIYCIHSVCECACCMRVCVLSSAHFLVSWEAFRAIHHSHVSTFFSHTHTHANQEKIMWKWTTVMGRLAPLSTLHAHSHHSIFERKTKTKLNKILFLCNPEFCPGFEANDCTLIIIFTFKLICNQQTMLRFVLGMSFLAISHFYLHIMENIRKNGLCHHNAVLFRNGHLFNSYRVTETFSCDIDWSQTHRSFERWPEACACAKADVGFCTEQIKMSADCGTCNIEECTYQLSVLTFAMTMTSLLDLRFFKSKHTQYLHWYAYGPWWVTNAICKYQQVERFKSYYHNAFWMPFECLLCDLPINWNKQQKPQI